MKVAKYKDGDFWSMVRLKLKLSVARPYVIPTRRN